MKRWARIIKLSIPKDFSTVAVFDIVAKALVALSTVLLIRATTVETYATYVKFNTISSLVFSVVGTSLSVAFVRGGTEYSSRGYACLKVIFRLCSIILLSSVLILALISPVLVNLYSTSFAIVFVSLLYGTLQSLNRLNGSYFQVKQQFALSGMLDNAKNVSLIALLALPLVIGIALNISLVCIIYIVSVMIPTVLGLYMVRRRERSVKEDNLDRQALKSITVESLILLGYWLLLNLIDQTDIIMVNRLMDDIALSNYGVALKYYQLLLTLQASLATVLRIRTSDKSVVDDTEKQISITLGWIKKTSGFIIAFLIISNLFANPIMNFLNGDRYGLATAAFRVFTVGAAITYLFAPNTAVMMARKKYGQLCFFTIVGFIINVIIDITLIPVLGIVAAAIATVAGNAFINVASFVSIVSRRGESLREKDSVNNLN